MKALCWKFFRTRVRLPPPPPFLNYMKRHQYTCLTHVFVRPFSSIGIGIPPPLYQIAIPPVPQADPERNEYPHPMFFAPQADNITHPSGKSQYRKEHQNQSEPLKKSALCSKGHASHALRRDTMMQESG